MTVLVETRVVTAHVPLQLAKRIDRFAKRRGRTRDWVAKQALAAWVDQEVKRRHLTCEALADVDAGRVIDHQTVQGWVDSLTSSNPLPVPQIPLVERKPGALRNGAPFTDLPAPLCQLKHGLARYAGGDRIMAQVLAAVPVAGLDAVMVAVELVLENGSLSAEHALNVVARLTSAAPPPSIESHLPLKQVPVADTARYDRLRSQAEEIGHA